MMVDLTRKSESLTEADLKHLASLDGQICEQILKNRRILD